MDLYSVALTVHLISFGINIASVIAADTHALLWVVGYLRTLPRRRMVFFHRVVSIGLFFSIISGAYLFSTVSGYLLAVPAFYVKVALVLMLVVNAFVIHYHMRIAFDHRFQEVSRRTKIFLFLSGGASTVGWIGVVVAAQYFGL